MAANWFVEESMPDGSFRVLEQGLDEAQALTVLYTYPSENPLEIWSTALADSPKGFAPAAFKRQGRVMISNTLAMLAGLSQEVSQ
jgi:hypothetical protein